MSSPTGNRAVIFIDGSNLYGSLAQSFHRTDIDVGKLITKLVGNRTLVKAYYYNAPVSAPEDSPASQAQQSFFRRLTWIPFLERRDGKLRQRRVQYRCEHCGQKGSFTTHVQKGVDTHIAVDLVTQAIRDIYDLAVLVSGDSDFVEAVRFVQDHARKHVENAFTASGWAPDLRGMCNTKVLIDRGFLADCWLNSG